MIEGRTILCLASSYDAPPTSKHHIMHLLAQRNVVLWVNYHGSRVPSARAADLRAVARTLGRVCRGLREVRPGLHVLTPMVVPLPSNRQGRRLNHLLMGWQIRRALARVQRGPLWVWSFAPDVAYIARQLPAQRTVYYCVDDFANFSGYDGPQTLRDEAELCRHADLVVTTAAALQKAKAPWNPNTMLVSHGVDYEHFAAALRSDLDEPTDVAGIGHPRFGFFGLIRDWVNLDLLAAVAARRPAWHFVLIGDSAVSLKPYQHLPNMHFLGARPYAQLPAYCKAFDVGVIPFALNELTRSVNPIKLREYLAAGLPVVSTPLPEACRCSGVHLAWDAEQFIRAGERALRCSREDRRAYSDAMRAETWPAKLELIDHRLKTMENDNGRGDKQPHIGRGAVLGPSGCAAQRLSPAVLRRGQRDCVESDV